MLESKEICSHPKSILHKARSSCLGLALRELPPLSGSERGDLESPGFLVGQEQLSHEAEEIRTYPFSRRSPSFPCLATTVFGLLFHWCIST